jgi:hypothetical protein
MTYSEKSTRLALDSSVAVLVLGNEDCTDIEMLPLKPRQMPPSERDYLQKCWHGRGLKSLGVMGLVGPSPRFALKEPLEPERVSALADAFLEHVHAVFCDGFAEQEAPYPR